MAPTTYGDRRSRGRGAEGEAHRVDTPSGGHLDVTVTWPLGVMSPTPAVIYVPIGAGPGGSTAELGGGRLAGDLGAVVVAVTRADDDDDLAADLAAVLRWTGRSAHRLRVDPRCIVVLGDARTLGPALAEPCWQLACDEVVPLLRLLVGTGPGGTVLHAGPAGAGPPLPAPDPGLPLPGPDPGRPLRSATDLTAEVRRAIRRSSAGLRPPAR